MTKVRLTKQDWADLARSCGLRLEYDGACHALPLIFALTYLERVYGRVINPMELEGDELMVALYLGASVLESSPAQRDVTTKETP